MTQRRPRSASSQLVLVSVLAVVIALILVPALVDNLTADERSLTGWVGLAVMVAALVLLPVGVVRAYRGRRRS